MPNLSVKLPQVEYRICIQPGLLSRADKEIRRLPYHERGFVITSPRIRRLHGQALEQSLHSAGVSQEWIEVPEGEQSKCLAVAERLYTCLIRSRADRNSLLVAFGGGVIGDLAGFVAATYLRGIRSIQIPTTLLAQIDSSIGGKVGVNHPLGKNLIGAFHQPVLVLADPACLQTLPAREIRAGFMEAIKYGIIGDSELFAFMERSARALLAKDPPALLHLVHRCAAIKAQVVAQDERESNLRMILNFGHTLGHALEAVTEFRRFKHGEAVGWGMIFASLWAKDLGHLEAKDTERILRLVHTFGLPSLPVLSAAQLIEAMGQDKKRSQGALQWMLPDQIGHVFPQKNEDRRALEQALIRHGIARSR